MSTDKYQFKSDTNNTDWLIEIDYFHNEPVSATIWHIDDKGRDIWISKSDKDVVASIIDWVDRHEIGCTDLDELYEILEGD